jgi:hypothetical protein
MPIDAQLDVLNDPPRAAESRFELAARRRVDEWLAAGRIAATRDDLRIAADFLGRFGLVLEPLPGGDVRLRSPQGRSATMSRAAALVEALRCLAGRPRDAAG